ncbi:MAG: hypothetical protein PHY90_07940 [Desulfitobacteriaceae bacterium]|jgi:hypothetical protein|nr:hypothetical protein [Desulfitobacteriaceae bacterium]
MYVLELFELNLGWILLTFSLGLIIGKKLTISNRCILAAIFAGLSWYFMRISYYAAGLGIALDNQPIATDPGIPMTFLFRLVAGISGFQLNNIYSFQIYQQAILTGLGIGLGIFVLCWTITLLINAWRQKHKLVHSTDLDIPSKDESCQGLNITSETNVGVSMPIRVANTHQVFLAIILIIGIGLISLSTMALSGPLKPIPPTKVALLNIDKSKLPWSPTNVWSNMERKAIPYIGSIDISKESGTDNIPIEYLRDLNLLAVQNNNTWGAITVRTKYGVNGQYAKLGTNLSLNSSELGQLSTQYQNEVMKNLPKTKILIEWYSPQLVSVSGMNAVWVCYRTQGNPLGNTDKRPITVWEYHFPNNDREHILTMAFQELDIQWWYLMSESLNSFRITEIQ